MKIIQSIKFNPDTQNLEFQLVETSVDLFVYSLLKWLFRIFTILFAIKFLFLVFSTGTKEGEYFNLLSVWIIWVSSFQLIKTALCGNKFLPAIKHDFAILLFLIFIISSILIKQSLNLVDQDAILATQDYWLMSIWGFLLFALLLYMLIINFNELRSDIKLLKLLKIGSLMIVAFALVLGLEITDDMLMFLLLLSPFYIQDLVEYLKRSKFDEKLLKYLYFGANLIIFSGLSYFIFKDNNVFFSIKNTLSRLSHHSYLLSNVLVGKEFVSYHNSFVLNFLATYGLISSILLLTLGVFYFRDFIDEVKSSKLKINFTLSAFISFVIFSLFAILTPLSSSLVLLEVILLALYSYRVKKSKKILKWKLINSKYLKNKHVMRFVQVLLSLGILTFSIYMSMNLDRIFY